MTGKLYGVGVGPGDPELLTLKAVRIIRESDMIAVAGVGKNETIAYQIAEKVIEGLDEKECLDLEMPMIKDEEKLDLFHQKATAQVIAKLQEGKNIAFLILGDPTIYSTYQYIHKRVIADGYSAEMVNGIPSFCAAAARMNIGLVERAEMLHVIPASYEIEEAMKLPGTKVLMKAGSKLSQVKETIKKTSENAMMIVNCGMDDEQIYGNIDQLPDTAGYMSLLIVKE